MRNLLRFLSPFAPDTSGVVSVLFPQGGLIVVCDAGGCTGNICGFDEPRWFTGRCALFSAALRDMDAILGRDDKLIVKLASAMENADATFSALVGTPVPAVIGTDFRALKRSAERRTGKPCVAISCTGTGYYDSGAQEAYREMVRTFSQDAFPVKEGTLGILGATPLDQSLCNSGEMLRKELCSESVSQIRLFESPEDFRLASENEKNLVVSPCGVAAAELLKEKFGTPWEIAVPWLPSELRNSLEYIHKKRVLAIHQQFAANRVRELLPDCDVTAGSFFTMRPEWMKNGDKNFSGEEEFIMSVKQGNYDVIIGDPVLHRAVPDFSGEWIPFIHFAVSGRLEKGEEVPKS